MFNSYKSHLSR